MLCHIPKRQDQNILNKISVIVDPKCFNAHILFRLCSAMKNFCSTSLVVLRYTASMQTFVKSFWVILKHLQSIWVVQKFLNLVCHCHRNVYVKCSTQRLVAWQVRVCIILKKTEVFPSPIWVLQPHIDLHREDLSTHGRDLQLLLHYQSLIFAIILL